MHYLQGYWPAEKKNYLRARTDIINVTKQANRQTCKEKTHWIR